MPKKRSLGLTILGWGEIVIGGGGILFASFCWLLLIGLAQVYGKGKSGSMETILHIVLAMIATLSPIVTLIIGIGILRLKRWAWTCNVFLYFVIYIYIYAFFYALAQRLRTSEFADVINNMPIALWFSIPIATVFYLIHPKVKAQFFNNQPETKNHVSSQENPDDKKKD